MLYGDVASAEVLRHADVDGAEVIVSTIPDELLKGTTNEQLVRQLRELAPQAVIIANCARISEVNGLRAAGADHVFRVPREVALGILPAIYAALNAGLPSSSKHSRRSTARSRTGGRSSTDVATLG